MNPQSISNQDLFLLFPSRLCEKEKVTDGEENNRRPSERFVLFALVPSSRPKANRRTGEFQQLNSFWPARSTDNGLVISGTRGSQFDAAPASVGCSSSNGISNSAPQSALLA